jgi:hypothetical protein
MHTRSGPLRKVSNAFAETLLTVLGRARRGVTVAVEPPERLFVVSIFVNLSIPSMVSNAVKV